MIDPKDCVSTHGAAGYAEGSYWDKGAIVCGMCGTRIENPHPTGARFVYEKGFRGFFGKGHWEPKWPAFVRKEAYEER